MVSTARPSEAEEELFSLTKSETMTVTVIRPALVYGPAVKGNLALMLKGIEAGWFPPIPETNNQRSMIHVDDLVDALLFVASHPDAMEKLSSQPMAAATQRANLR